MKCEEKNNKGKLKVTKIEEYQDKIENLNKEAIINALIFGVGTAASIFIISGTCTHFDFKNELFSVVAYSVSGAVCMGISGFQLKNLIENVVAKVMYQDKLNSLKEEYLLEDEDIIDSDSSFEDVIYNDESEIDIDANSDSTINIKHVHTLNIK